MYCSCFQQDRLVRRLLSAVTYLLGSFGRDSAHMASLVFAFSLQEWAFSNATTVCNYPLNRYKLLGENRCVISYFSLGRFQRGRIDGEVARVNSEYGILECWNFHGCRLFRCEVLQRIGSLFCIFCVEKYMMFFFCGFALYMWLQIILSNKIGKGTYEA